MAVLAPSGHPKAKALVLAPAPPGRAPRQMTWEDFTKDRGLPHGGFEYVDGHAVEKPMASDNHTQLRDWLLTLGNVLVAGSGYGRCSGEPFTIRLPNGNGRRPDVFFWSKEQARSVKQDALHGPADLVIEVLSPSTRAIDEGEKFDDYQAGGVLEYWMLDPDRPRHTFHALRDGQLKPHSTDVYPDGREIVRSATVPGLWFDTAWFNDRPPVSEVLAAWQAGAPEPPVFEQVAEA